MRTYFFHVNGMHCNACVTLIETELAEVPEVKKVKASLAQFSVEVSGDFGDKTAQHVAEDLSRVLKPHDYTLSVQKQRHMVRWADFLVAVPAALVVVGIFILLQRLGVVNLVSSSSMSYGTAFVIGLIASVSTCMAVVGGLVLSLSANFAKEGDRIRPQLLLHIGRLVAFFVLGGVIGALGSAFQFGATGTLVLGLLIGFVMLLLGLNLLDVLPWAKKLQPTLPSFMGKRIHGLHKLNHTLTPALVGVATFFLPCGFTQSMQLYALTTGSFIAGGLFMFVFALGTLPVLGLISFSSLSIHTKAQSGIFFKAAGLVVMFFGLFNIYNSLVGAGLLPALFSF